MTTESFIDSQKAYCENAVRRTDPDRYRLSLSQNVAYRPALWALFAFNHEIAKTREVVSEPTLGLIRLQWWRDALRNIYAGGAVPAHEILQALAATIKDHALPFEWFDMLLNAREFDLGTEPAADLAALATYAEQTTMPLNRLALRVVAQSDTDAAIDDISTAYALIGLLRAGPFRAAKNLPLLLPHGVSAAEIAAAAGQRLAHKKASGYLAASKNLTAFYVHRLEKANYELRDPRLAQQPIGFALKALLHFFR